MPYTVVVSRSAEKELHSLPKNAVERIIKIVLSLQVNPRPVGCKKLKGFHNLWRVRVGNYRIIYSIDDVIMLVDVREIGDRKDVYK
ncbi:MAG: addiction module toxin, RelE/StbE family [Bacteroidetes bacterium]|nr:addiction module toxin, RelE/StbE family [Bacteroidota bacterium]